MATAQNQLIERLPRKERLHLLAWCEPVELVFGEVLCEPGTDTRDRVDDLKPIDELLGD